MLSVYFCERSSPPSLNGKFLPLSDIPRLIYLLVLYFVLGFYWVWRPHNVLYFRCSSLIIETSFREIKFIIIKISVKMRLFIFVMLWDWRAKIGRCGEGGGNRYLIYLNNIFKLFRMKFLCQCTVPCCRSYAHMKFRILCCFNNFGS